MFYNYSKPGKGVQKRDPDQSRIKTFFEILQTKLWSVCKANLLYAMVALPFLLVVMVAMGVVSEGTITAIVAANGDNFTEEIALYDILLRGIFALLFIIFFGAGPVTAGSTYIAREFANERPCWWISDFFDRIKKNFKQGMMLWLLDLLIICSSIIALVFYSKTEFFFISILYLCFILFYAMMHIYAYHIMITFALPLKSIIKNAFVLVIQNIKITLTLFTVVVALNALPFYFAIMRSSEILLGLWIFLEIFLLPMLMRFTTNFFICPIIEECITFSKRQLEKQEKIQD